jgi:hypothetical protein
MLTMVSFFAAFFFLAISPLNFFAIIYRMLSRGSFFFLTFFWL